MAGQFFNLPGTNTKVARMGYGAMQLAGPNVFGPPNDAEAAVAVLRKAVEWGVNHIDTSDFYGPHITNQIIKRALHPYPKDLVIATKVGVLRGKRGSWDPAYGKSDLIKAVHDNLRNLGVDSLDIVNLRVGQPLMADDVSIGEPFAVLSELKKQGLIKHLGLSTVTPRQLSECQMIDDVVCVQNQYNLAHRQDDDFIHNLAEQGIAYVPYFPLGGFTPIQLPVLNSIAVRLKSTAAQVALSWLYQLSPNILLIPGTSSLVHLQENIEATSLTLSSEMIDELGSI